MDASILEQTFRAELQHGLGREAEEKTRAREPAANLHCKGSGLSKSQIDGRERMHCRMLAAVRYYSLTNCLLLSLDVERLCSYAWRYFPHLAYRL